MSKVNVNLPNYLTVARLLLTVALIFCLLQSGTIAAVAATLLFMLASWTDFYDGYYAKKYNLSSNFGKIMDPIADKFLILSVFFIFAQQQVIPYWMFYLIFAREVVVTASRLKAIGKGTVLAAEMAGKFKTLTQLFVIWIILLFLVFQENGGFVMINGIYRQIFSGVIAVLMTLTVILTIVSGISYFWNNRKIILFPATA